MKKGKGKGSEDLRLALPNSNTYKTDSLQEWISALKLLYIHFKAAIYKDETRDYTVLCLEVFWLFCGFFVVVQFGVFVEVHDRQPIILGQLLILALI